MKEKFLHVVTEDIEGEDFFQALSPAVGVFSSTIHPGTIINPGGRLGVLEILGRQFVLCLPDRRSGSVAEIFVESGRVALDYLTPLFRISPVEASTKNTDLEAGGTTDEEEGAEKGSIVIKAPTDGIFYRRPSPDAAAYADLGATVRTGSVLGLIEVMKCFNQIRFLGPGIPPSGKVVAIVPEDGDEVKLGQSLFFIDPV